MYVVSLNGANIIGSFEKSQILERGPIIIKSGVKGLFFVLYCRIPSTDDGDARPKN